MATEGDEKVMESVCLPLAVELVLSSLLAISLYNALELFVMIFASFTSYNGLYFWSLLLSTSAGIVPYALGFLVGYYNPSLDSSLYPFILMSVGWWVMTVGESLVLYSRLHLVLHNPKVLRFVLFMIVANALVLHLPSAAISFRAFHQTFLLDAYFIIEKVQMTVFSLQELIISTLYIWETIKMLKLCPEKGNRRIMSRLISINIMVTIMDIGLLAAVYADLFAYEPTCRVTIYSIKLKLEFAVLGQLVNLANSHSCNLGFTTGPNGFPDFVDPTRITTDITHAPCPTSINSKPLQSESDEPIDTPVDNLDPHDRHPSSHSGGSMLHSSWSEGTQTEPINPNTTSTTGDFSRSASREKEGESNKPVSECPG